MNALPGISGTLLPSRFLSTLVDRGEIDLDPGELESNRRRLNAWWRRVEATCGPATGLRALFDVVAMPLMALLGFRARDAVFSASGHVRARLVADGVECPAALVLLPWASRPSRFWRDLMRTRDAHRWHLLLTPPFLSLVDGRGQTLRRSLDFRFPDLTDSRSFPAFWTMCSAEAFRAAGHTSVVDTLVERAGVFQDSVRTDLQRGVLEALATLGPVLASTSRGSASFHEALTIVYRILFLLFAESRELVPRREAPYAPAYAMGSFCREALGPDTDATGLWEGLAAVTRMSRSGCDSANLIVRPFNGHLFARASAPTLETKRTVRSTRTSRQRDLALRQALIALGTRPGSGGREDISYSDLGVEQLGAVYERVLDLDPNGASRKETGTFYTPQPLAEYVVRRTLTPLVSGATADEILRLRVVDPAMGSGAFLVAACRFLADAYERALIDEGRLSETDLDAGTHANIRRLVAARCLAGVDANPVAVQLARLSLWLTTLAKDKPLSFFDHQLRTGDSLVGASPDDLWRLAGPGLKRRGNREMPLLDAPGLESDIRQMVLPLRTLRDGDDNTIDDVRSRERLWAGVLNASAPVDRWRAACDLWCARWFWEEHGEPPSAAELSATLDALLKRDATLKPRVVDRWITVARSIARRRGFFHWPIEFADEFYQDTGEARGRPGFDAVIGNPPWEMLRRDPKSSAGNPDAPRNPLVSFLRQSGLYPSCDRGHVNLYQPFVDRALSLTRSGGRLGLVLPWGLATDDGAASLRRRLFGGGSVESITGLDNSAGLFPIHRALRFMVIVARPDAARLEARARFGIRTADEIENLPGADEPGSSDATVRLSVGVLKTVGGPALRIPDVRRREDFDWFLGVSRVVPPFSSAAGWAARFGRELNATEDRASFGHVGLPVIEGKHLAPFRVDASVSVHRIRPATAARLLPGLRFERPRLAYRDVSGVTNKHALIAAVVPAGVVTTHTLYCLRTPVTTAQQAFLCGLFNSTALNTIVRMLMSNHIQTSLVENLPVPLWTASAEQLRIAEIADQLTAGPSAGDTEQLRSELNALVSRLYDVLR